MSSHPVPSGGSGAEPVLVPGPDNGNADCSASPPGHACDQECATGTGPSASAVLSVDLVADFASYLDLLSDSVSEFVHDETAPLSPLDLICE